MCDQSKMANIIRLPSHFLPPLVPLPPLAQLLTPLALLQAQLAPSEIVVDLTVTAAHGKVELEVYEVEFARGWLKRLVSGGLRAIGRGQDEDGEWERLVERAAGLLSAISGHGGKLTTCLSFLSLAP